jgi:hypothetical protein
MVRVQHRSRFGERGDFDDAEAVAFEVRRDAMPQVGIVLDVQQPVTGWEG